MLYWVKYINYKYTSHILLIIIIFLAVDNESEASTKQFGYESQKPKTELTKPQFTTLLNDILITEGDNVHLECIVKGEPMPSVNWYLNNIDIITCSDRIQVIDIHWFLITYTLFILTVVSFNNWAIYI